MEDDTVAHKRARMESHAGRAVAAHLESPRALPLPTLPTELFANIIKYTDRSTALVASRTTRHFHELAEPVLWKHLRLYLPLHYGEVPYVRPEYVPDDAEWEKEYRRKTDVICRAALKAKVSQIITRSNARRLAMVVTVTVAPAPGSILGTTTILDLVSPTLRQIHAKGPVSGIEPESWADRERIECTILEHRLSFPSLTHVYLHRGAIKHLEFIPLLCQQAPSLRTLDVTVATDSIAHLPAIKFPRFSTVTSIEKLRLCLDDAASQHHPVILALLRWSVRVRHLSIEYINRPAVNEGMYTCSCIFDTVARYGRLRDLHWEVSGKAFCKALKKSGSAKGGKIFRRLQKLSLQSEDTWVDAFLTIPTLPKLFLISFELPVLAIPSTLPIPYSAITTLCRANPHLQIIKAVSRADNAKISGSAHIRLENIQTIERDNVTCQARSCRRDKREVSYLFFTSEQAVGKITPAIAPDVSAEDTSFDEGLAVGRKDGRNRVYSKLGTYKDFDGQPVPNEVLQRLGRAPGSPHSWSGRGFELGNAGWKVLEEWKATILADALAEDDDAVLA